MMSVTQTKLKELFVLKNGEFIRLVKTGQSTKVGDIAGGPNPDGYQRVKISGKTYLTHRLVWLYETGSWPINELDHINGNKQDNRIENLRDVTRSENLQNLYRPTRGNPSGFLGVSIRKGMYCARIRTNGVLSYIGTFSTPEQASSAYLAAKRELHPSAHTSRRI